jgi:pimeloyl-ACP methyl ester carboxylesterase
VGPPRRGGVGRLLHRRRHRVRGRRDQTVTPHLEASEEKTHVHVPARPRFLAGGWVWEEVARLLEARGHRVLAPTLPGHHRRDEDRARIGHDDLVVPVLAALEAAGPDPVVLVGHSLGGAVISQVADRRPDRITRLVYCDAFVPHDGEAVVDLLPAEFTADLRALAAASPDRSLPLPWELWRTAFMQTAEEAAARAAFQRLVPDPYRTTFDPVRLPRLAGLALPATFVHLRQDQTMSPGYWHPGMSARIPGVELVELDGDHEVMLTAPARLADALDRVAAPAGPPAARRPKAISNA